MLDSPREKERGEGKAQDPTVSGQSWPRFRVGGRGFGVYGLGFVV